MRLVLFLVVAALAAGAATAAWTDTKRVPARVLTSTAGAVAIDLEPRRDLACTCAAGCGEAPKVVCVCAGAI